MNRKKLELFLEFLLFGLLMGITEDIIAVKAATGASITLSTIIIITIVAIPFAIVGELLVDRQDIIKIPRKK